MKEKITDFINNNIFAQVFGIFGFIAFLYCAIVSATYFVTVGFLFAVFSFFLCFAVIFLPFFMISILVAAFLNFVFFIFPRITPKKFFNNKIVALVRNIGLGYIVFSLLALLATSVIIHG